MPDKTKILILGIGQSNFLNQLYGGLIKETGKFEFSINNYRELSKSEIKKSNLPYTKYHQFSASKVSNWKWKKEALSLLVTTFFWKIIFFELSQGLRFKALKAILIKYAKTAYMVKNELIPLGHDVYHFHFCTPENLLLINFLPKDAKIICSFWGSDLMRITGVRNVYYLNTAFKKANVLTIQTPEMAEMLYCKYGRALKSKTEILRFTISEDIYANIDLVRDNSNLTLRLKQEYNIDVNRFLVAIGHNGFKENNHLKILNEILQMPLETTNKCVFLLHLSYGCSSVYLEELKAFIAQNKSIEIKMILDYFGPEKIATLRVGTDILIQMPETDALSGAMTEVLYSGNTVIAGAWLPYDILRRNGVKFKKIESFDYLASALKFNIDHLIKIKNKNLVNKNAITEFLSPAYTNKAWLQLFNKINNNFI